ncbi:MAG: hypothetical protein JXR07_13620 [Reichenbachiella sp.]
MTIIDIVSIGWAAVALIFLAAQASSDAAHSKKEQKLSGSQEFKVKE